MFIVTKPLDGWSWYLAYGGRPQPRRVCVRWGPSPQKGQSPLPNFKGWVRGEIEVRDFLVTTSTETMPVLSPGTVSTILDESLETGNEYGHPSSGPTPIWCHSTCGSGVRYSGCFSTYPWTKPNGFSVSTLISIFTQITHLNNKHTKPEPFTCMNLHCVVGNVCYGQR